LKKTCNSELVNIGRAGSAVGLRGEFRVTLYSRDSENLKEGKVLLLKHRQSSQEVSAACTGVRLQNGNPIVRIEGITDRTAAEALKGMEIYITPEDLEELPEGEHYVRDIIGYTVRDIASGTDIGTLNDVIQNTAQSVLDIRTAEGKQVLVPAVDAFMRGIDDEAGVISVELIPGFL
jgi:16S rRNA processing protein RimM